jgi:hypothetical protein
VVEEDNASATNEEESTNFLVVQICLMGQLGIQKNVTQDAMSLLYMNV